MSNSKTGMDRPLERRQLTILECDLVGSTTLASQMDQEDYASLVIAFRERVTPSMRGHGGFIFQYVGDAVWVYFGYPQAQEDAIDRAIRSSLAVMKELRSVEVAGNAVRCRICIATGVCVIGDIGLGLGDSSTVEVSGQDHGIVSFGDSLNLVARLKSVADPGTVVVAEDTHALAGNAYEFSDLKSHLLKGLDAPVRAWQVLGETRERSRFRKLRPRPSARLVGRVEEMALLTERWELARGGQLQVIDVSGEPGIGKSRLLEVAVKEILNETKEKTWWFHCSPQQKNSAFFPIVDQLLTSANVAGSETAAVISDKIKGRFPSLDADATSLLMSLLSIGSVDNTARNSSLTPSRRRKLVLQVLVGLVEAECAESPLLILTEDAHWADPSTEEFLRLLAQRSDKLRLLILVASRLQRDSANIQGNHLQLHLTPLTVESSFALVRSLSAVGELSEEMTSQIVASTDGVPLFIEDVTLSAIKSLKRVRSDASESVDDIDVVSVPIALRDHLMTRIDRLEEAKKTAQAAAVIGRVFSRAMLESIVSVDSKALDDHLLDMLDSDLVSLTQQADAGYFSFKHALVRDAAYESLLKTNRVGLHGKLAKWIEKKQPDVAAAQPEIVAFHHEMAGNTISAISYWLEAGRQSLQRVGYVEATSQLKSAYELLLGTDPSLDRDRIELDIITALGAAHAGAGAFSSENTGRAYERALYLCNSLGNPPETLPVFSGACAFYFMRADFERARGIAMQCLQLVNADENATGLVVGHRALGAIHLVTGRFFDSIEQLQTAIAIYERDPARHRGLPAANALDHKTTALCFLALAKLAVGSTDDAIKSSDLAMEHSQRVDQHSVNYSLCYRSALLHLSDHAADIVYKVATESLDMALREGYATWVGISRLCQGEALMRLGEIDGGLIEIEQGVTEHATAMAVTFLPFAQSVLAKGYLLAGRAVEASKLLDEASRLSLESHQLWLLPEIHRLYATSLEQQGLIVQAEAGYRVAVASARDTGAGFWRRKAELNLSELLLEAN